jgi:signal transduction histidine kinase
MRMRPSLKRRMIVSRLVMLIVFAAVMVANLAYQSGRSDGGEADTYFITAGNDLLRVVNRHSQNEHVSYAQLRLLDDMLRESTRLLDTGSEKPNFDMAIRVVSPTGTEIYRTPDRSSVPFEKISASPMNIDVGSVSWRVYSFRENGGELLLQIARVNGRFYPDNLPDIIKVYVAMPLLLYIPIAILVAVLLAGYGIAPLNQLAEAILKRNPDDLTPLNVKASYAELDPVVNAMNGMLSKLDAAIVNERNFISDVAHELRTPLAVIQAQVHALAHARVAEERRIATKELREGTDRAVNLVNKFLMSARIEARSYEPRLRRVNLTALLQERMVFFSQLAGNKKITLELDADGDLYYEIDSEMFGSMIDNLLDNAIRYSKEGGRVTARIDSSESGVQVTISDDGPGIPEKYRERAFDRFFRVPGTEQSGSGLGLNIARRIAAQHGGTLTLSDGPESRGLAVNIRLPRQKQSAHTVLDSSHKPAG